MYEGVMSRVKESCHICRSHVTCEKCSVTYEGVMSRPKKKKTCSGASVAVDWR